MAIDDQGTVTCWFIKLRDGDQEAAQQLWERYFTRLVNLARSRLRALRVATADADEEDAALSAIKSFCARVKRGEFPQLADRDNLWSLLVTITIRKASDYATKKRRQKRGGGRVRNEADLGGSAGATMAMSLDQLVSEEMTPELAAMVAEECRNRLDSLDDEALRQIAEWKLEGYTNLEIAKKMGRSGRLVAIKLALIRMKWEQE